ncbi:hypothetical protein [Xanthobacter pseudotagetidis]|uniref:hypothetical protein n=1 Tax=Xanthobacter pseudotagetidis TaxID=3119911 RepID=UPI0037274C19
MPVAQAQRRAGPAARAVALALVAAFAVWVWRVGATASDADRQVVNVMAQALIEGQVYSETDLLEIDRIMRTRRADNLCVPLDLRSEIMVRLALVEGQIRFGDAVAADRDLSATEQAIHRALACDPNMSMAWIALAWAEFARNDLTPRAADFIRMSMVTGPNEAFSVVRRVQLLLDALPKMTDPALRDLLAAEVRVLMQAQLNSVLAFNFVRVEDPERKFLEEIFATGSEAQQAGIAAEIWRSGENIDLPLAPARGARPWN